MPRFDADQTVGRAGADWQPSAKPRLARRWAGRPELQDDGDVVFATYAPNAAGD
jgi:hypothetical protein